MAHHLFLIPGYLGYRGKEGYWGYWDVVLPYLKAMDFLVHPVPTEPIGAIERRAARLCEAIRKETRDGDALGAGDAAHLVGFSTGGLDARYLVSPGTPLELPPGVRGRIRTVASLSTPHYGTPLADAYRAWKADDLVGFFVGIFARRDVADRLANLSRLMTKYRESVNTVVPERLRDEFWGLIEGLAEATPDEREQVRDFLSSLATSRGALRQLTVRKMPAFNEATPDAPDIRYLSYVSGATPLKPRNFASALYAYECFLCSRWSVPRPPMPKDGVIPPEKVCAPDGKPASSAATLTPELSDGIVPSCSQFWGEFRAYAPIDHHAVYGRVNHLLRAPEFAGAGLQAFYERIGADLLGVS